LIILAKKGCFSISRGKKQISPLLGPLEKFWKNPLLTPPGKNPSDAHGCEVAQVQGTGRGCPNDRLRT